MCFGHKTEKKYEKGILLVFKCLLVCASDSIGAATMRLCWQKVYGCFRYVSTPPQSSQLGRLIRLLLRNVKTQILVISLMDVAFLSGIEAI